MKGLILTLLMVMSPAMANSVGERFGDWNVTTSATAITAHSTSTSQPKGGLSFVCSADHQNCFILFSAQKPCKNGTQLPLYLKIDSTDGFLGVTCVGRHWKASGYPIPFIQTVFDKLLSTKHPFSVTLNHSSTYFNERSENLGGLPPCWIV
ncbi:hypothetical protein D5018_16820 [Parashewanella curva]|uniref:Uncharacterized protein n=1 Tax=Parashewanella curva TaxID=2338552 RepID=A0A3L8PSZ7_9GAMM|nr:hypothetical protein [Parashewanella curva]RLV58515.1 hypothetical protein D5018_16820 [Parashewanella curva]